MSIDPSIVDLAIGDAAGVLGRAHRHPPSGKAPRYAAGLDLLDWLVRGLASEDPERLLAARRVAQQIVVALDRRDDRPPPPPNAPAPIAPRAA